MTGPAAEWPAPRLVWGVAALVRALGDALGARFASCTVRGEISGFSRAASGHCYFNLKDADGEPALLRCAMFRRSAGSTDFEPAEGMQVELRGRIAIYEPRGELQFVVQSMARSGVGALYEQFLRSKARLEALGLFDAARKKALPAFVQRVGVVTSPAAAALRDVTSSFARRAPQVELIVYPSPVQGADAPVALAEAIALAGRRREVDVLIVCRGGGSLEDLWSFNDERVVRAIAASPLPVICGVGHETDITLADLAADRRAPTPTAAAELAAPARRELLDGLATLQARWERAFEQRLQTHAQRLDRIALQLARPVDRLRRGAQALALLDQRRQAVWRESFARGGRRVDELQARLMRAAASLLEHKALRLGTLEARVRALDPRGVMARGYAWLSDDGGQALTSARQVHEGQALSIAWSDGQARATVTRVDFVPGATSR